MIIKKLIENKGDVRNIIKINPDDEGFIDISDDDWEKSIDVIESITFNKIKIKNQIISPNFIRCSFYDSKFVELKSDGHFWASSNRWEFCEFKKVELCNVISSLNYFENCSFEDCSLTKYHPYQTLFKKCRFRNFCIEGMKARTIVNKSKRLLELESAKGTLLFLDCIFISPKFFNCFFEGVEFKNCKFENPKVEACSFEGTYSDDIWWQEQEIDPFVKFIMEILKFIEKKFGKESASFKTFYNYYIDYTTGRTKSRDYSECLYNGNVPENELDEIENELDKIELRFPF